jgi:hypothetical protein
VNQGTLNRERTVASFSVSTRQLGRLSLEEFTKRMSAAAIFGLRSTDLLTTAPLLVLT